MNKCQLLSTTVMMVKKTSSVYFHLSLQTQTGRYLVTKSVNRWRQIVYLQMTLLPVIYEDREIKMAAPIEKLQQLETIEKDIATVLQSAGQAIQELSKDKPNSKIADNHTGNFLKALESVENGLFKQINYLTQVSTGQPHEGSSYAAQKVLQMAWHRLEHARSKVNELERLKNQHAQAVLRQAGLRQSMNTS